MSALLFLDVLAYSGSMLGVIGLLAIGIVLMRPHGAVACLSVFITDEKARECVEERWFQAGRARALGTLFLFVASLMGISLLRGIVRL